MPRSGNARFQRPRRDCRARGHRHSDLHKSAHSKRLRAIFAASLAKPTAPTVVADLICDIVDGDSWQLRYLAGPDAAPVLKARASKTDEQVISEAAQSDEEFIARVKRERGLDITL